MNYEQQQREEIDSLNAIYEGDVKLLRSKFPFKLQIDIKPFLEIENLILPWDYPELFISMIVDMGKEYPKNKPIISFFSNNKGFLRNNEMTALEKEYNNNFENRKQDFLLMEIIEKIREQLYIEIKTNFKKFRKIRHFLEDEEEDIIDHDLEKFEDFENLTKKDTYTVLTDENFKEWNQKFLREVRSKKKKNRVRKVDTKKPTGREIFQNSGSMMFVDDDDGEDDEENVQVDEDVFGDDADLDGLEFD